MNMNGRILFDQAITKLQDITEFRPTHVQVLPFNAKADLTFTLKGTKNKFITEVKKQVNRNNLGAIINQLKIAAEGNTPLLIAEYINSNIGDTLRAENINYIDTVGNAYINQPPTYILIQGNKAPKQTTITTGRAFTPTGLKVIYALLVKPDLLNATYRHIAEAANVALGAVGWVLGDLKNQNYIQEDIITNTRKWNQKAKTKLIDKWVEEYPKLKQKHLIGRYTTNNPEWWKKANLKKYDGLFAGELAANKYTQHLRPQDHLVYINEDTLNNFLNDFRLGIAANDNAQTVIVDVVAKFWGATLEKAEEKLTTPLLTYADLIASTDARNREVAMMVREKLLEN